MNPWAEVRSKRRWEQIQGIGSLDVVIPVHTCDVIRTEFAWRGFEPGIGGARQGVNGELGYEKPEQGTSRRLARGTGVRHVLKRDLNSKRLLEVV